MAPPGEWEPAGEAREQAGGLLLLWTVAEAVRHVLDLTYVQGWMLREVGG